MNTAAMVSLLKISLQHRTTFAADSNAYVMRYIKSHAVRREKGINLSFCDAIWSVQLFFLGKQDSGYH